MATSKFPTKVLSSEKFVESCGAILFDLSNLRDIKVCLIQYKNVGEWYLAKGRRNQGETRKDAAVREVMEETGYRCRLLPVTMPTRATSADSHADIHDQATVCEDLTEPFMCHIRTLKNGKGSKIIWWFIAVLEEDGDMGKLPGEEKFMPVFLPWREALNTLTFQNDRDLVFKALEILQNTIPTPETFFPDSNQSNALAESSRILGLYMEASSGGISKTAGKKAAKAAKAEKRKWEEQSEHTERNNLTRAEEDEEDNLHVEQNNQEEARTVKTPHKVTYKTPRMAKRHWPAASRASEGKVASAQSLLPPAPEAKNLQSANKHPVIGEKTIRRQATRKLATSHQETMRTAHQETVRLRRQRYRHGLALRNKAAQAANAPVTVAK